MFSLSTLPGIGAWVYPERPELRQGKLDRMVAALGGMMAPLLRPKPHRFQWIVAAVGRQAAGLEDADDNRLLAQSRDLRPELRRYGFTETLTARAFALVREAARRRLGTPHYDVQLTGGLVLLNAMVAEMETGEGKTLTATLPACTLALAGVPVHVITVNDYLAQRDAELMGPVYNALGLSVGVVSHGLSPEAKRRAYRCDVTYLTNKDAAFDYLRDRIVLWDRPGAIRLQLERLGGKDSRLEQLLMRGLHYAIVDEADSVLIDEARTPLIISAETREVLPPLVFKQALEMAQGLTPTADFVVDESDRSVELTDRCREAIRRRDWPQTATTVSVRQREELVRQALVALHLFHRDKHYLVRDAKVQIIDEYTGRLMADRSWENGLHQLIELKEDCPPTVRRQTKARISYQRFFRRYLGLAGMTGTAREVAGELWSIYGLKVVSIPTNRPLRRDCLPEHVFVDAAAKWQAVVAAVARLRAQGRPVLVGTRSVEASEALSGLLNAADLPHRVLNARQDKEEAQIIAQAGRQGWITVATNMAGRGTDIQLDPGVSDQGGLHVIATERHEARRIDRQLFGRCARQGDRGACEAFVSLEDDLIKTFIGDWVRWAAVRMLLAHDGTHARRFGRFLFWKSQLAAERLHGRIRRDLLTMDEQLSDSLAFTGKTE